MLERMRDMAERDCGIRDKGSRGASHGRKPLPFNMRNRGYLACHCLSSSLMAGICSIKRAPS